MKIRIWLPIVILVAATAMGCVSNKKYAELQSNYNKSLDTNSKLKQSWQVTAGSWQPLILPTKARTRIC